MEKFAEVDADIGDEDLQKSTGRDDYNQNIFLLQRFHAVPTTDILRSIVDGLNEKENNRMDDVCYVCLEAGDNVIRSPCACRAPVHQRCFVKALMKTSFKCTICQTNCDHVVEDLARKMHQRLRAEHCPVAYEREEREREERERNEMLDRHAQEMRELLARQARDQEKRHERQARRARRATANPTS